MELKIRTVAYGSAEQLASIELRRKILREPLGLNFTAADFKDEDQQIHIACFSEHHLIGILILVKLDHSVLKMRQVAVDTRMQNKGVGRGMVLFAEKWGSDNNFSMMRLNARKSAVPFYLGLQYETKGGEFTEVGIPHYRMEKVLSRVNHQDDSLK